MSAPTTTQLLTQADVARLLQVTTRTVRRLKIRRVRIGRAVRYRQEDVQKWIDKQRAAA